MGLKDAAKIAVENAMGVKEDETVLIICDEKSRKIGYALFEAAHIAKEPILVEMKEREGHGEEPPELVSEAMLHCDVTLIPTTSSISHTQARKKACDKGARISTLPGITEDIMVRTLNVNYQEMKKLSDRLSEPLTRTRNVHVKTEKGTELKISIEGRIAHSDTGICHSPGDFSNLPAGESYIAPVEGTANGKLIIDGSLAGYGLLKDDLIVNIEDGYIKDIKGEGSDFLRDTFRKYGRDAWNIAELGIGTNPAAKITGAVLEDEKVKGTIHIAFGDNSTFGGNISVDSHLDGVLREPTLLLDERKIMEKGIILD